MELSERARKFAEKAHEGQTRKTSDIPMFTHLT